MGATCVLAFFFGLPMCCDSGFFMFDLMNDRCGSAIVLLGFLELVIVCWFYGASKVLGHIEEMGIHIPRPVRWYWWTCWVIVSPAAVGVLTLFGWAKYSGDSFLDYEFPAGAQVLGWLLELTPIAIVLAGSAYVVGTRLSEGKPVAFVEPGPLMTPSHKWGPRHHHHEHHHHLEHDGK